MADGDKHLDFIIIPNDIQGLRALMRNPECLSMSTLLTSCIKEVAIDQQITAVKRTL